MYPICAYTSTTIFFACMQACTPNSFFSFFSSALCAHTQAEEENWCKHHNCRLMDFRRRNLVFFFKCKQFERDNKEKSANNKKISLRIFGILYGIGNLLILATSHKWIQIPECVYVTPWEWIWLLYYDDDYKAPVRMQLVLIIAKIHSVTMIHTHTQTRRDINFAGAATAWKPNNK